MDAAVISSRHNPLVRDLRASLRLPSRRSGLCVLEGWRLLREAAAAGVRVDLLVVSTDAAADPRAAAARAAARKHAERDVTVTPEVFAALTQVPTPQGVLGIAPRPDPAVPSLTDSRAFVVVLDGIQDPGNVGAIVRTAVACGATAVLTCGPTADPFGPKALRASAGAAFRVPVADVGSAGDAASALASSGTRIVVADVHAPAAASPVEWTRPLALVLGNESAGPAPVWAEHRALAVRVPIVGPVESLNVAAAAAVLLYEAAGLYVPTRPVTSP